jgi:DNA repair exonuclease SbcCD ATPase subunit
MRLLLRDEAREHADNLESLAALRDAAVDLLARRMLADAPGPADHVRTDSDPDLDDPAVDELPPGDSAAVRTLARARGLLAASEQLLAAIGAAIDALSVDNLTPARDVATLTAIHRRLMDLHRREAELHTEVPQGAELTRSLAGPLARLAGMNRQQTAQLEDEIIRLDDLVDDQVVAQIEQLVARLQASQQKLIDLLEKLKAGDESVRGEIDQLQQRIREDLRRLAEARSKLDKEVGQEFLNLDAFDAMEAKMRQQDVSEQLRQGDVDGALQQARGALDELRTLRDSVQQRIGDNARAAEGMTPQERARMELMRG